MLEGFGASGQKALKEASVLIAGLGGLGAPVSTYLAAAGAGRLGLCDSDVVSLTNLQRQTLYCDADVGEKKTECAARRLSQMSPATVLDVIDRPLTRDNAADLISRYDMVIDCTDNFATRLLIDSECRNLGKPWVHGALDGAYGCVTVFNFRNKRRLCDLYENLEVLAGSSGGVVGTFGPVAGVIGSIQAMEAIKVLSGYGAPLDGKLLMADLKDLSFEIIEF